MAAVRKKKIMDQMWQNAVALLLIASIVLSLASGFTTYLGMKQYVAESQWLLALGITFGLQVVMFAMAWIAAEALGTSIRKVLTFLMIYLVCAFVSVFFSFSSLFGSIFTAEQRDAVNANYVRSFFQQTVTSLNADLETQSAEQLAAAVASPAFQDWHTRVRDVIQNAQTVPEKLNQRALAELERNRSELSALNATIASMATRQNQIAPEIAAVEARAAVVLTEIAAAEEQVRAERAALNEVTVRIDRIERDMQAELTGIGSTAGAGPKYRALNDEKDGEQRKLIPLQSSFDAATRRLEDLRAEKLTLDQRLRELRSELGRIEGDMTVGMQKRAALEAVSAGDPARAVLDVNQVVVEVENLLRTAAMSPARFAENVNTATERCAALLREMQADATLAATSQLMSCDLGDVQALATTLQAKSALISAFRQACDPATPPVADPGREFATVVTATEACISLSATTSTRQRSELAALISSRGPTAHPFVVAQNALFVDRLPISYMAAAIAVVIDALILLVAMIANMVGTSKHEKALRLIQNIRTESAPDGTIRGYAPITGTDLKNDELRRIISDMTFAGVARFDEQDGRLYFLQGGREYVYRELDSAGS